MAGLTQLQASGYVSLFWFGMLIGRFMGAVELSDLVAGMKRFLLAAIPIAAVIDPRGCSRLGDSLPFICRSSSFAWILFQLGKSLAGRTLMIFSLTVALLLRDRNHRRRANSRCGASSASACSLRLAGRTPSRSRSKVPAFTRARRHRFSSWRSWAARFFRRSGLHCRPLESPNLLSGSAHRLCLCRFLRLERTQGRQSHGRE